MAKKFVKVSGLHNIFNATSATTLDITSIKTEVADRVNSNSIVFITADSGDVQYGYPNGFKYIWTCNELYPTNESQITLNNVTTSSASFYAPTVSATVHGQVLVFGGTNSAPAWSSYSFCPTISPATDSILVANQNGASWIVSPLPTSSPTTSYSILYYNGNSTQWSSYSFMPTTSPTTNSIMYYNGNYNEWTAYSFMPTNSPTTNSMLYYNGYGTQWSSYSFMPTASPSSNSVLVHGASENIWVDTQINGQGIREYTTASIYAPTNSGQSGQFIMSSGSGAPVWTSTISPLSINQNNIIDYGGGTNTVSIYAPTASGSNGQFLMSTGSGAPTWTSVSLNDEKVKVSTTTTDAKFPLMAVATSSITVGNTYQAIYDTGIVINPNKHSVAEGAGTTASGYGSHAEGVTTYASETGAHAEGASTTASGGYSHAEGYQTIASGTYSHAEGYQSETGGNYTSNTKTAGTASGAGDFSHAEGNATIANGVAAHSEGVKTLAKGNASHAEGNSTTANGNQSHAEGYNTITNNSTEHAQGSLNISHINSTFGSANATQHSIGIGASNTRKNAFEVMQNGDAYLYGVGNYDGIHIKGETGAPSGLQTLQEAIGGKQNTLTTGDNIDITNNTISALGYEYDADYESITTGFGGIAYGLYSHAEGQECMTGSNAVASHAEGVGTETNNINEHAEGRYNVSHSVDVTETQHEGNTVVSVGIGEDGDRKNAFEIMQNGDIYVYGVGYYDGTATKYDDPNVMTLQDIIKAIADNTGIDLGVLF